MSAMTLAVAWIIGSAALAAWTYVRFGARAPRDWRVVLAHLGLSMFVLQMLVPRAFAELIEMATPATGVLAIVAVAAPSLTYLFLASLWLLAMVNRLLFSRLL
jgi:hypothetical protein